MSSNDLRVAVSLTSSSSLRTGPISLLDLFQLAKTSSDVRPSAGLLRVLNGSVRLPSVSEISSDTNTWEAGKMPVKTCCTSLAWAENLGCGEGRSDGLEDNEDGSEDSQRLA